MKTIPLTRGKVALVDDEDYEALSMFKWYAAYFARSNVWRPMRYAIGDKRVYMHIQIMGKREGFEVDHRNRDGLDNQRDNLRWATKSQNAWNRRLPGGASGFIGVYKRETGVFRATIRANLKQFSLGEFQSAVDAAAARDAAAIKLHGQFAVLNFPQEN